MKNSLKTQLWIGFGVILASLALATAAIYYFSGDLAAQADRIIADKALISRQAAVVDILARLKREAPVAAAYLALIDKVLPTHDNLIGLPQWLDELGRAHGVTVIFAFQGNNVPMTASAPGADGFVMTVTGAPAEVASFLTDLELNSRGYLLSLDAFSFAGTGVDYKLSAQGRVFSR